MYTTFFPSYTKIPSERSPRRPLLTHIMLSDKAIAAQKCLAEMLSSLPQDSVILTFFKSEFSLSFETLAKYGHSGFGSGLDLYGLVPSSSLKYVGTGAGVYALKQVTESGTYQHYVESTISARVASNPVNHYSRLVSHISGFKTSLPSNAMYETNAAS